MKHTHASPHPDPNLEPAPSHHSQRLTAGFARSREHVVHELITLSRKSTFLFVVALPGAGRTTIARDLAGACTQSGLDARYASLRSTDDRAWLRNAFYTQPPTPTGRTADRAAATRRYLVIDDAEWGALFPVLFKARAPGTALRLICFVPESVPPAVNVITSSDYRVVRFSGLGPRSVLEAERDFWPVLWTRGSLARSLLADSEQVSLAYRKELLLEQCRRYNPGPPVPIRSRSYEERLARIHRMAAEIKASTDLEDLLASRPELRRFYDPRNVDDGALTSFLSLAASAVTESVNFSTLGRSYGVSHETARTYTRSVERGLLIDLQAPYCPPLSKRLVRRPRLLFTDTGLLHAVLGIETTDHLLQHVQAAASWRNFVVTLISRTVRVPISHLPFWSTHTGASVDALWWPDSTGRSAVLQPDPAEPGPHAVLATLDGSPRLTRAMQFTCQDLELERLWVVCPANRSFDLDDRVRVLAIRDFASAELPAGRIDRFAAELFSSGRRSGGRG